ncbi:MAG: two-component system response regulator [Planctomycetes bacterium RBG_16_55_9]|nr:MAG: two-component system response regulator [Planctomycetes bacterium RBG_16_55_9]
MKNSRPILLVDDDSTDLLLFERALKRLEIASPIVCSSNGREALEYLMNPSNRRPWIVLTDLNTPRMNGFEFLRTVKAHEALKRIVVVVLSGSSDERDVARSFRLGAAGYITKPPDYQQLLEMIRTLHGYWTLSKIPSES